MDTCMKTSSESLLSDNAQHSLFYSLIQQVFIKCLPCARYCFRCLGYMNTLNKDNFPCGTYMPEVGDIINNKHNR